MQMRHYQRSSASMENVYIKTESVHDESSSELEYPVSEHVDELSHHVAQSAESAHNTKSQIALPKLEMSSTVSEPSEFQINETLTESQTFTGVGIQRDGATVYGEHVANKLRTYDAFTRAEVEHKINCILHEADMHVLYQSPG
ncbi:uncharacterized protein LOC105697239 [Orussus abietinus]|uniref:uncharacterized protein LOC105697239 n=1 Tax=Orussus abietinus TaxID=222816 RepID=UPI000626C197|nr:uncharacterized protein LOC105697239 [Orussus abietinus]